MPSCPVLCRLSWWPHHLTRPALARWSWWPGLVFPACLPSFKGPCPGLCRRSWWPRYFTWPVLPLLLPSSPCCLSLRPTWWTRQPPPCGRRRGCSRSRRAASPTPRSYRLRSTGLLRAHHPDPNSGVQGELLPQDIKQYFALLEPPAALETKSFGNGGLTCNACYVIASAAFPCRGCSEGKTHLDTCPLGKVWSKAEDELRTPFFQITGHEGKDKALEWLHTIRAQRVGRQKAEEDIAKGLEKEQQKVLAQLRRHDAKKIQGQAYATAIDNSPVRMKRKAAAGPKQFFSGRKF